MRVGANEIGSKGRATSGVIVVRMDEGARVIGFDRVEDMDQHLSREQETEVVEAVRAEDDNLAAGSASDPDNED